MFFRRKIKKDMDVFEKQRITSDLDDIRDAVGLNCQIECPHCKGKFQAPIINVFYAGALGGGASTNVTIDCNTGYFPNVENDKR